MAAAQPVNRILYRFFFEEGVDGWPDAGCAGCSSFADGVPDLGLLHARDITFAMASPAHELPITCPSSRRLPWRFDWRGGRVHVLTRFMAVCESVVVEAQRAIAQVAGGDSVVGDDDEPDSREFAQLA